MTWNEFYEQLKRGELAPAYVFTGEEEYIKREALEAARNLLLPPGLEALNDATLENPTAQQIIESAETLPVMCEKRLLTVVDWAPLLAGKGKADAAELGRVTDWLENPPDTCAVVFYLRAQQRDDRKAPSAPLGKHAPVVIFEPLSGADLTRWCAQRLKPLGKKLQPAALNLLTLRAGSGLTRLSGELDKLAAYAGDRREITPEDVEAIVSPSLEDNVFKLTDHLLSGDMAAAQLLVKELLLHGEEPLRILATIAGNVRLMAHIKCALDAGSNVQAVTTQLKLNPYRAKILARQCFRLDAGRLTRLFQRYVALDAAVKGGQFRDRDALDTMLFALAELGGKGKRESRR